MLLQELIKSKENGTKFVSARDLHRWLEIKRQFSDWKKQNVFNEKYSFVQNKDFTSEHLRVLSEGTNLYRELDDYHMSIRMANHLAIVSKTQKGIEARDYFCDMEQQYYKQTETNLKLGSMLLTHKDKLNLTKELFYPILEQLGVITDKKNTVHQMIIKNIFGKYENVNKLTMITDEDIENYKKLAINLQKDTSCFEDKNQITVWDIIKEL